jgi:hypothetical protein
MLKYSKFIRICCSSFQVYFFRTCILHFQLVSFDEEFNCLEEEYLYRLAFIKYISGGKPSANRNISELAD